jgi:hypothetical protein
MGLLTKEALSAAMQGHMGLPAEAADAQAESVLDIFGFDTQVIDNILEPEDRQFFYILQAQGFLTTRSEETTLWNGQEWRTHYWILREERIARFAEDPARVFDVARAEEDAEIDSVYAGLPDLAWRHH